VTTFALIGAVMVLAALASVLGPLLLARAPGGRRWPAALLAGTALPVLAFVLYGTWSNWRWEGATEHDSTSPAIAQMLASLEAKLEANPTDVNGWLLLGRSYFQLNRYFKAADAYQQAYTLTQGKDVEAVIGLGEALAFADERMLESRSAELFERALEIAPQHPKALWYAGLVAYQAQRFDIARQRWSALVALDPPAEVKQALQAKIAEIDAANGGPAAAAAPATAASPAVRVRVAVAPELANRVPNDAPLFVMVRAGEGGGPPLAVARRTGAQFPLVVELTDRDAMVEGRGLSTASRVTVVARVARSGDPRAQSGDLEGKVDYDVTAGRTVDLIINSIVP
jgi:cytochrome c-type biogenesis protein CcmH